MCLLKSGPERLPMSWFPLAFSFAIYSLVSLASLIIANDQLGWLRLTGTVILNVVIEGVIVCGLLAFGGVLRRMGPTMTALLGTHAIVLLLMLPINALFLDHDQPTIRLIARTIFLGSFLWGLTIAGFILRRASNVSLAQGIAIALSIKMLAYSATLLIPATA